jgi:DNA-3-methyladenine glycosylase II
MRGTEGKGRAFPGKGFVSPLRQASFRLKPRPPFRLDLTAWALRRRAENAVDRFDGQIYRRVFALGSGPVEVAVRQRGSPDEPEVQVVAKSPKAITPGVKSRLRAVLESMLGLQADLTDFYRFAGRDAYLGPLSQRFRGLKPPRFSTLFEATVNGIACQQLTLTVGILLLNRLAGSYGLALEEGKPGRAFPRPQDLARLEMEALRGLGFSRQKSRALIELSQTFSEGGRDLEDLAAADDEIALARLEQLRGVGRWTAEYVLLRGLGRLHVFPGDDVGGRNKLRRLLGLKRPLDYEGTKRILSPWQPYGGLVYFHLLLDSLAEEGTLS